MGNFPPPRTYRMGLGLVLLLALTLRLYAVDHHLPYIYHPDEPLHLRIVWAMFTTGDWNPRFFNYPSLFLYVNVLADWLVFGGGHLLGLLPAADPAAAPVTLVMGTTFAPEPALVLVGRLLSVALGVGTVGLVYLAGRSATGRPAAGLLAALMAALSPTLVVHARYVTPDIYVGFFATAALVACLAVYRRGHLGDYALAGLLVGLAASSKYNGALVVFPLLAAHFQRPQQHSPRHLALLLALIMGAIGFLLGTPYALLDFGRFWADLNYERQHYAAGHAGMEGDTLRWYLHWMWRSGGTLYLLAALGAVVAWFQREQALRVVAIFPPLYFGFIASFVVRNDRTFLPLDPFCFVLAAALVVEVAVQARQHPNRVLRWGAAAALAALVVAGLTTAATRMAALTAPLVGEDNRTAAQHWIDANLPAGTVIALESYSPYVDPARYKVHGLGKLIDVPPAWYRAEGIEIVVAARQMYGRFYAHPQRYTAEVAAYDRIFDLFPLVQRFGDGGFEIRIHRVPTP